MGLTPELSETSKIAPKLPQGLQGRTPPGSKGHPRDVKRAPRDLRRASCRALATAQTTTEPKHFVRNRRWSKHLNISLVPRTHRTQFWPAGMRAAFKFYSYSIHILFIFSWYSVHIIFIFSLYSVHILCIFASYSLYILFIFSSYSHHILFIFSSYL